MKSGKNFLLGVLIILVTAVIVVMTSFIIIITRREALSQGGAAPSVVAAPEDAGTGGSVTAPVGTGAGEVPDTVSGNAGTGEDSEDILWDWNTYPGGSPYEIREGEDSYPYSDFWLSKGYYGRNGTAGWLCGYDEILEAMHCTSEFLDTYSTPVFVEMLQDVEGVEGRIELALVSVPRTSGSVVSFYATANAYPREAAGEQWVYLYTFDKETGRDQITEVTKAEVEALPAEERYVHTRWDRIVEMFDMEGEDPDTVDTGYTKEELEEVLNALM